MKKDAVVYVMPSGNVYVQDGNTQKLIGGALLGSVGMLAGLMITKDKSIY